LFAAIPGYALKKDVDNLASKLYLGGYKEKQGERCGVNNSFYDQNQRYSNCTLYCNHSFL
jgi:hypothetical protein